jgi:hypothetical protein
MAATWELAREHGGHVLFREDTAGWLEVVGRRWLSLRRYSVSPDGAPRLVQRASLGPLYICREWISAVGVAVALLSASAYPTAIPVGIALIGIGIVLYPDLREAVLGIYGGDDKSWFDLGSDEDEDGGGED